MGHFSGLVFRYEAWGGVKTFHLPAAVELEFLSGLDEKRKLDAGGAGVENNNSVLHHATAFCRLSRRAFATSAGTAQDASRAVTESARLVRTMGTRAPTTIPAASASAMKIRLFASMFPASRSGTTRTSARPATGESIFLILAAPKLIALSNASGPSRMPPTI